MKKPKILYLMHVSWGWIKQRPHFLAEGLSKFYKIKVYCEKGKDNVTKKHESKSLKIQNYLESPFKNKRIITILFYYLKKIIIFYQVKKNNIIWLTFPAQFNLVEKGLTKKKILIYDCMDDMLEIYKNKNKETSNLLFNLEKKVCNNADILICSSDYLKNKLLQRYNLERNIFVVNNALASLELNRKHIELSDKIADLFSVNKTKKIIYIGTISVWFDFDTIINVLNQVDNINLILIGPKDVEIPENNKIKYYPPVEHKYVFSIMKKADALIMPFKINELIKSVNPVKAYEYIASGKPVILTKYGETEKFNDFAYLYNNEQQFKGLIDKLQNNELDSKQSLQKCLDFAKNNTWKNRLNTIQKIIEEHNIEIVKK